MARADYLNMFYSKNITPLEFNFDAMMIPSMWNYMRFEDAESLYTISTSLKYQGNIEKKYKAISKIMKSLDFRYFATGTNRVIYSHYEDTRFLAKIAVDRIGLTDSPREFENQMVLKPFVTKMFEVSPHGAVGFSERVQPINTAEEFISVAEDIFNVIKNFIGKYVLEDIGTKFFMNWGLRNGFGPCLLDYPYLFELDGQKLRCNKLLDPNNPFSICGGEIDYDDGFNYLICSKCGTRHLAKSLKKENGRKEIQIIKEGFDMPIEVKLSLNYEDGSTEEILNTDNDVSVTPSGKTIMNKIREDNFIEKEKQRKMNLPMYIQNGLPKPIKEKSNNNSFMNMDKLMELYKGNKKNLTRIGKPKDIRYNPRNIYDHNRINDSIERNMMKQESKYIPKPKEEVKNEPTNATVDIQNQIIDKTIMDEYKESKNVTINSQEPFSQSIEEMTDYSFDNSVTVPREKIIDKNKTFYDNPNNIKESPITHNLLDDIDTFSEESSSKEVVVPEKKITGIEYMSNLKTTTFDTLKFILNDSEFDDVLDRWLEMLSSAKAVITTFMISNPEFECSDEIYDMAVNLVKAYIIENSKDQQILEIMKQISDNHRMSLDQFADNFSDLLESN